MTIERLFIRPAQGMSPVECEQVVVVAGLGIEGDRYFGRHDEPGQNLTLVEAEEIEAFLRADARPQDLSISGRNLITRGIRLNALVGRDFLVGNVRLRGVELCEPCAHLAHSLASANLNSTEVVRRLIHRAGLRADALSSGVIARGAKMTPLD